jgi:hypothetical protein
MGAKTYLLRILVALLVFNAVGASLLGLGLFITVPMSVLMLTAVFRQLNTRGRAENGALSAANTCDS